MPGPNGAAPATPTSALGADAQILLRLERLAGKVDACSEQLDQLQSDVRELRAAQQSALPSIIRACIDGWGRAFERNAGATVATLALAVMLAGIVVAGVSGTSLSGLLGPEVIEVGKEVLPDAGAELAPETVDTEAAL